MWAEFVVGSRPSEGFTPGSPVFPRLKKPRHFQISIRRETVGEKPATNSYLFIYLFIYLFN